MEVNPLLIWLTTRPRIIFEQYTSDEMPKQIQEIMSPLGKDQRIEYCLIFLIAGNLMSRKVFCCSSCFIEKVYLFIMGMLFSHSEKFLPRIDDHLLDRRQ
jgi:hypothetical protein